LGDASGVVSLRTAFESNQNSDSRRVGLRVRLRTVPRAAYDLPCSLSKRRVSPRQLMSSDDSKGGSQRNDITQEDNVCLWLTHSCQTMPLLSLSDKHKKDLAFLKRIDEASEL
jgi:hypothetical protein